MNERLPSSIPISNFWLKQPLPAFIDVSSQHRNSFNIRGGRTSVACWVS
jgi:hypothetical protein